MTTNGAADEDGVEPLHNANVCFVGSFCRAFSMFHCDNRIIFYCFVHLLCFWKKINSCAVFVLSISSFSITLIGFWEGTNVSFTTVFTPNKLLAVWFKLCPLLLYSFTVSTPPI